MKTIRLFCLLLALSLALLLSACNSSPAEPSETGDATGSAEGLSAPQRYGEAALPAIPDLGEWFGEWCEREQLTNALIYSEEGELWHCWLYVGCYAEGDRIDITVADGALEISVTAADPARTGCRSVLYFTYETATEPDANLTVNGSLEGIHFTHADTSLKP